MAEDDLLHVFEKDDEWVLVKLVDGAEGVGYVPASYVQEEEGTAGEEGFNGDAVQEVRLPFFLLLLSHRRFLPADVGDEL